MVGIVRKKIQHKYKPKTIRSRSFKNYDPVKIKADINNTDWEPLYNCENPNTAWKMLKETVPKLFDHHIPFTTKTIKGAVPLVNTRA